MATRVDVAKRAGVSPTTVSRVLNDNGYVAQDVRERVLKAIEELQYVPNRVARSLKMKRCGQFACVISSLSNPFYHEVLMGIEDAALQRGYTFSLYNMTQEKQGYMKLILEGFYDGLVFLTPYELMKVVDLVDLAKRIPLCAYQDRSIDLGVHAVAVDLYTAMKRNVQYLIGLGHRRIVFLGYEFERAEENPRYMGYVDAMHEHGLEIDPALVQFVPNLKDTLTLGRQRILEVLNRSISFTAVAASNDLLAVGAMRALTEWGVNIPNDVSVIGIDDVEMANMVTPALTTTRIPKSDIGNELVRLLLDQVDRGLDIPENVSLPTEIIYRESTGPVKS